MSVPVCVVDASVGVKWFRNEPGSAEARELVSRHILGEIVIAVDALFACEVLRVASRNANAGDVPRVWKDLEALELVTVPLGGELVEAAADVREKFGCTLYDGFSAGLADLLDAPLYSADARVHGRYPRVRMVGA
ncbi:MAG: type II toxin-antitoxin system VapC family toxin [Actinomycetota bacterium]|nr:type II toxin-antitoxin system VapC family toxin [Actinomycetota bacterium]